MKRIATYSDSRERCLYCALVLARIITTLIPQNGYIHPDEFHQSTEIMAGHIFNLEINLPREFNRTFPTRSAVMLYAVVGYPYRILDILDQMFKSMWNAKIRTPYLMVVLPRLMMTIFSFLIDLSLYKMCQINRVREKWRLMFVLASSHITFIYCTRSFTDTIEMILFSMLLRLVTSCLKPGVVTEKNFLKNYQHKFKFLSERLVHCCNITNYSMHHASLIGMVTSLGVFNRPTFVLLASVPIFYYLNPSCRHGLQINARTCVFFMSFGSFSFILILFDSFYYEYISIGDLFIFDISMSNFVITPINYLRHGFRNYNIFSNIVCPQYLRMIAKIPLMFHALGVVAIYRAIFIFIYKRSCIPRFQDVRSLYILSIIIPLTLFSHLPRYESHHMISITVPLILVSGRRLYDYKMILKIWCAVNFAFVYFYGFVHQAWVWKAATSPLVMNYSPKHLYTSYTYPIPMSFLDQPDPNFMNSGKYRARKSIFLHEMGTKPLPVLVNLIKLALTAGNKVLLIIPTSKEHELINENVIFQPLKYFYPHVNLEAPPNLPAIFSDRVSFYQRMLRILHSFGLGLYEAHLPKSTNYITYKF